MAAYLRFYQFDASPFENTAKRRGMVLGTQSLKGALTRVRQGLAEDSPRICLSGSAGVGKTSFCRALPKLLANSAQVVVILDPRRSWEGIRAAIAKKFSLDGHAISRTALQTARGSSKQLVVVIDQAEALSHESLDHLDILLQYKCDDGKQLLHCVMLADLDAASTGVEIPLLWWLDKFTTMQLQYSPIPVVGLRHYVEKHLAKAGWAGGELFTAGALEAIHCNTGGFPGAINELCEKILIEGGVRGITSITREFIEELCGEPRQETPDPELSSDFSIGDFGASPTAQEMLDADSSTVGSDGEEEVEAKRELLLESSQDISSLLVTQDSCEPLHVAAEDVKTVDSGPTASLELEDDPTEVPREEDFYCRDRGAGAAVGMTRSAAVAQSQRGPGLWIASLVVLALIAGLIYSQSWLPAKLVGSAESRTVKTLEQRTGPAPESEDAVLQDHQAKSSLLPPSILDRADEIAAESFPDSAPVSEDEPLAKTGTATIPRAEVPAPPREPASSPEAVVTAAKASPGAVPAVKSSKPTPGFSDELLVINEYTAIPEAASSAPKLPLPVSPASKPDTEPSVAVTDPVAEQEPATQPRVAPPAPARIAPDRGSDEPKSEVNATSGRSADEAKPEPAELSERADASSKLGELSRDSSLATQGQARTEPTAP